MPDDLTAILDVTVGDEVDAERLWRDGIIFAGFLLAMSLWSAMAALSFWVRG